MVEGGHKSWIDRRASLLGIGASLCLPAVAAAASARKLAAEAESAYRELRATNPKAQAFGDISKAVLIFPKIVKAGLLVGGQNGDGAMLRGGRAIGFYSISAVSYGLQIGAQKFGYALFFMTEKAIEHLHETKGWSVGTGLSVVFVDEGFAKPVNTTTISKDVYAIAFDQHGLMAGGGLEGAKIKAIHPDP